MVNNPQRIEITDPETGEVVSINPATAVSNLRDLFVSRRRLQVVATPWPNLTEDQQRDEINRATEWSEEVVKSVVEMVAQAGRQVIHAKLDNFKVKDGEVTITGKGRADDGALLSLNHVGNKYLKIGVADAEQFDQQRDDIPSRSGRSRGPCHGWQARRSAQQFQIFHSGHEARSRRQGRSRQAHGRTSQPSSDRSSN